MAMKLLSLAAAVTAASASSNNNPLAAQPSHSIGINHRALQDSNGNSYTYLDDLSGYSLQYSNCVRVKIPQDNDDDAEGNVNFYNGSYRAQYSVFATFHVCGDGSYNSNDQCGTCDYGVEYAADVNTYLETSLDHWGNYCTACQNSCGGRNRRLDDADAEEDVEVDCDTCANDCASYYQDDGNDETQYMECAEGIVEDDMQLYYGPACDDGQLVIGVFYDDECTMKTKHDAPEFDYYKFDTFQSGCIDCSSDDGQETCNDLYGEALHCLNGKDQTGQDDMSACSTVKKALTVTDYGGMKKRKSGADTFLKVFFTMLLLSFVGGFFFLSYTYYIRHNGEKSQPMLSSEDVHEDSPDGGTLT
mmetsp:Transcript_20616/g.44785  ORF Transcript_20616/g.44785 Transcript_20616/m.44785 type:complete len:360 (+) Transcript_20616:98-1177(+)|eukprot:CAMPEP_0172296948 /NCGR_PEP_ID=MMETSP1058-20130122/128_1 /TAXON_ID=83371 /ORGANISM="Detonula confervacea, Strain CCMP 353" /LENGTH=359 /DNA_ID=CAMNT_0013006029 /DNA_START=34 /DNA_END=1113 /DNA_ORIENTATION=-